MSSESELISIIKKFKTGFDTQSIETILSVFSESGTLHECGPKSPDLPFMGTDFKGHDGLLSYLGALGSTLEALKFEFTEYVTKVNETGDGGIVYVKGEGSFKSKKTRKSWDETFTSRFAIEGAKIVRYDVWADSLSAYLAVTV